MPGITPTHRHPGAVWLGVAVACLILGALGLVAARLIEVSLHQDPRHKLVAPIQRVENA